jgi:hypothetical protein
MRHWFLLILNFFRNGHGFIFTKNKDDINKVQGRSLLFFLKALTEMIVFCLVLTRMIESVKSLNDTFSRNKFVLMFFETLYCLFSS